MSALFALQCVKNPQLRKLKYSQFISDPSGKVAKKKLEEESKIRKFDKYTNDIQLTEGLTVDHQLHLADALNDDYFKRVEMDLKL